MERRLFGIMTIGLVGSLTLGLWLLQAYALQAYASTIWLWVKLALAAIPLCFTATVSNGCVCSKKSRINVQGASTV